MMSIQEYIEKMQSIQKSLIDYIEEEENEEENYEKLVQKIKSSKITNTREEMKTLLRLIVKVIDNHHRSSSFFYKIEGILKGYKNEINEYFNNSEIFYLFKSNKRILLFLIEEGMLKIDSEIAILMMSGEMEEEKYAEYFSTEIKELIDDELKAKVYERRRNFQFISDPNSIFENKKEKEYINELIEKIEEEKDESFEEKRRQGENDDIVSEMIRKDQIEEFITYVNKENYSIQNLIKSTIYETNQFLIKKKKLSLIEYAAFHGSNQIFKYLHKNQVPFNSSLFLSAIHGYDSEIIYILLGNGIENKNTTEEIYEKCYYESIKCHHNDIAKFIENNFLQTNIREINIEQNINENIYSMSFKSYNFSYFPNEMENIYNLIYACKYDYMIIVKYLINTGKIDINTNVIYKQYFF